MDGCCRLLASIPLWMVAGGLGASHLTNAWFPDRLDRVFYLVFAGLSLGGPLTLAIAAVHQLAERTTRV